jgi:hypothetical protein
MPSQAQIDANRRNAQSSTGPLTEVGKAAVASNAFKHGLRANIFKQPMTDPENFDQFLADLVAEHQPQTSSEAIYVERMALCLNKLAFLEGMQNECLFEKSHQFDLNEHQALNVYWSQENRLERAYDRAFDRLRALQKERLRAHADLSVPDPGGQTTSSPSVTATLPIEKLAS